MYDSSTAFRGCLRKPLRAHSKHCHTHCSDSSLQDSATGMFQDTPTVYHTSASTSTSTHTSPSSNTGASSGTSRAPCTSPGERGSDRSHSCILCNHMVWYDRILHGHRRGRGAASSHQHQGSV